MSSSTKKRAARLPRVLRKPMIPAAALLALDVLTLAAAAVLNALRGSVTEKYYYADGVVISSSPYSWFGAVAAGLAIAAAAVTALIIAGAFLARGRHSADIAFETGAAVLLLVLSAGAAGFSLYIVNGEQPQNITYTSFTDEEKQLIFAEEQYREGNLLKIYLAGESDNGECARLVCAELKELSHGNAGERFKIMYVTESRVNVSFADGTAYRTLELTL